MHACNNSQSECQTYAESTMSHTIHKVGSSCNGNQTCVDGAVCYLNFQGYESCACPTILDYRKNLAVSYTGSYCQQKTVTSLRDHTNASLHFHEIINILPIYKETPWSHCPDKDVIVRYYPHDTGFDQLAIRLEKYVKSIPVSGKAQLTINVQLPSWNKEANIRVYAPEREVRHKFRLVHRMDVDHTFSY